MRASRPILVAVFLATACDRRGATSRLKDGSPGTSAPLVAAAPAAPAVPFTVVSDIPDCLTIAQKGSAADANLLLGIVALKTTRIPAACGCTSKWLLYRSVTAHEGLETELASGSLLAGEPGGPAIERLVVLLGDREHPPNGPLTLHVGCEPAP